MSYDPETATTAELLAPEIPHLLPGDLPAPHRLVRAFLSGRNPSTLRAYQKDLGDFASFLTKETAQEACAYLLSLSPGRAEELALAYLDHLQKRGLSAATQNRRIAALKSLVSLAHRLELCSFLLKVEGPPQETYRDTRGPGAEGVQKLLGELAGRKDKKAVRDRALLHLLYDLALRRGEVLSLDREHVDLKEKVLWVLGKGRQDRQRLSLPDETRRALADWLQLRGDDPGPLFHSLDYAHPGSRLTGAGLYALVKKLGDEVGVKARPHGLRHAAITAALDQTSGDVRAVQKYSRHKDPKTLLLYDDARRDLAGSVARLVAKTSSR